MSERAGAARPAGAAGTRHDAVDLDVIPPAVGRGEVASTGRVGCVAYPYRVYDAESSMDRPVLGERVAGYVVSVDRVRRLALRADVFPTIEPRTVEDALVLPAGVTDEQAREKAREAVFNWTLRKYSPLDPPKIAFTRHADAYKLFWLAERDGGDVIVDSVRGDERPLDD
ncbi:hypothetical protein ACFQPA_05515 [Halomarina halobia]|uniref:RNA-binding protein n=1 Tax=Halomarina halobia TaxID=3033386 RepID=A0ABD6A6N7_9EURY|nr:hypothetical protein [Halomarina sp. PSR21]